jgi:peptidoglycan hydrolase-like protein with peptidoglycan-binding domain
MLTRARFSAYDPEVYRVQAALDGLGFDPGTIDGIWGPATQRAALDFRSWADLGAPADTSRAGIVDDYFNAALDRTVIEQGISIGPVPATRPGGSGTSVTPAGTSAAQELTPPHDAPSGPSLFFPVVILGLGIYLVWEVWREGAR